MGFEPRKVGDVPEKGLAFFTSSEGQVNLIPLRSMWLIVADPTDMERIIPAQLVDVGKSSIKFKCGCGQKSCTRVLRYVLKPEGFHPPVVRRAG